MKTMKLLFASMCMLGIVASSVAQVQTRKSPGVLGYLDPRTGAFHTLPVPDSDAAEAPAVTTTGGSFVVSFTISVKSAIVSTAKIACSVSAVTIDNIASGAPSIIEEEAAVLATRSGTSATCTVTIPYSWNLATATSDKVTLTYVLSAPAEATATTAFPQRLSTQTIATIPVPANGATTHETVTATF